MMKNMTLSSVIPGQQEGFTEQAKNDPILLFYSMPFKNQPLQVTVLQTIFFF